MLPLIQHSAHAPATPWPDHLCKQMESLLVNRWLQAPFIH